jgi:hypothetical protein
MSCGQGGTRQDETRRDGAAWLEIFFCRSRCSHRLGRAGRWGYWNAFKPVCQGWFLAKMTYAGRRTVPKSGARDSRFPRHASQSGRARGALLPSWAGTLLFRAGQGAYLAGRPAGFPPRGRRRLGGPGVGAGPGSHCSGPGILTWRLGVRRERERERCSGSG